MEISIVDVPPQMVLGMKRKGRYKEIAEMIPKVCQHAIEKGAQITGPPIFVCHEKANSETTALSKASTRLDSNASMTAGIGSGTWRTPSRSHILACSAPGWERTLSFLRSASESIGPRVPRWRKPMADQTNIR